MNTKSIPSLPDLENRLFEVFRDQLRERVLEALDITMIDFGIPSDTPHRKTLIGARDEDLPNLFAGIDKQAEILWGRGAGKHLIEKELVKLAHTQDQETE